MSTAKHDGNDENGVTRRRYARLRLALLPMAILLIGGCDVVLGIDSPIRSARDAGPQPATGVDGDDDAGTPAMAECEDGLLRCDDSASGNRSKCSDGKWIDFEPCDATERCDSQAAAACRALPVEGEHCDVADMLQCTDVAKPGRRICDKNKMVWLDTDACASGEACDRTDGSCRQIVPVCVGHMPGDFVCDGATRHTCGQDLTASDPAECMSAAHCQQSKGAICAICTQGQFNCDGAMLQTCNAAGDGWTLLMTCTEGPCNAMAGACTTAPCTKAQRTCSDNQLQVCNADQTDWELLEECEDGLCDMANGECDVCSANTCDGNTRVVCAADGQSVTRERCEAICTGAGECVECLQASDCEGEDECRPATCVRNHCVAGVREPGGVCDHDNGACDGAGICFPSTLAGLTPYRARPMQTVFIQAKPGRCIHAPGLAVDAPATGTIVTLTENGEHPTLEATVASAGTDGSQRISLVIPERVGDWSEEEIVSVLVDYTPPAAAGAGGAGGTGGTSGTGGAGGTGGTGGTGELGGTCDDDGTVQKGAIEFRYRR